MPIKAGQDGLDVIVLHDLDNVATALRDLQPGEAAWYQTNDGVSAVVVVNPIPFGHKVAIRPIGATDAVVKYGEVIGRATTAINPGEHVHIHNVEGIRGRGDLTAKEALSP